MKQILVTRILGPAGNGTLAVNRRLALYPLQADGIGRQTVDGRYDSKEMNCCGSSNSQAGNRCDRRLTMGDRRQETRLVLFTAMKRTSLWARKCCRNRLDVDVGLVPIGWQPCPARSR
jgi:hypothetical protein